MTRPGLQPFRLLHDPSSYLACTWEMTTDDVGRNHWAPFFVRHFDTVLTLATEVEIARGKDAGDVAVRVEACREELRAVFADYLRRYREIGRELGRVNIITFDRWRDGLLRKHGLHDPFELLKDRENRKMLPLLPTVVAGLDALPPREQVKAVVEGVFAGNIFDMGAEGTAKAFLGKSPDFFEVRRTLAQRPWLIDDYDRLEAAMLRHMSGGGWKKVVYFVDNAGSDFLLGAVPMMRFFARHGAEVVLVANEGPTLNDMTVAEVRAWWPRVLETEPSLKGLPITIVTSGTFEPLIDLAEVSAELNAAAEGADLVVIEGMGRGVESNLDARFTVDALNIAMIKDKAIADRHGGKVYDCVCRFRGPGE